MKYRIHLYHGTMSTDLMTKLSAICNNERNSESDFLYTGTIDDFAQQWELQFAVYPKLNLIAVTQYNNFGAR